MSIATEIATIGQQFITKSTKTMAVASIVFISLFNVTSSAAIGLGPDTIADMVEENLEAVVNISTTRLVDTNDRRSQSPNLRNIPEGSPFEDLLKEFFNEKLFKDNQNKDQQNKDGEKPDEKKGKRETIGSLGSGFIISADGFVVTNEHVIADAEEITIVMHDGEELIAKVIGSDKKSDIALLKIDAGRELKFVKFGDDRKLRTGSWVVTIGNPFGLGVSVSAGIVSAQNRNINSGPYDDFIQTDAAINKGNSGGPLFNLDGEVVGVNAAIISPTGGSVGIGFSIPASTVVPVIEQLKEFGTTRRGWLGVIIRNVTEDIAESLGMDEATGAFVTKIFNDSPAEDAGIELQDVIIRFDGKEVKSQVELPRIVAETEIDKEITVVVIRDGEEVELKVTVGLLKDGEAKMKAEAEGEKSKLKIEGENILGLQLQELTDEIIEQFKLDEGTKGLMVVDVDEGSAAEEKALRPGDRILEAAQSEVNTYKELNDKIAQMKGKERKTILLLVETISGGIRYVALPIE
ncbi:MAG: Do family serine endopeptidase [Rhizobiales bacterium]|nr:Do family serine endopeptidase [Hyphomicrobiales bacterium]NRB13943.1 Do family serine endopeptidase [Hyphomicrobiales bacterium]